MNNDAKVNLQKCRIRMEKDIYSVLLTFKDGATPDQIIQRMNQTFGYTYEGKYSEGGFKNLTELLEAHQKIRSLNNGYFKVIVTDEVADLHNLIAKQKDGRKKLKNKPIARPYSAAELHHPNKSNSNHRPSSSMAKVSKAAKKYSLFAPIKMKGAAFNEYIREASIKMEENRQVIKSTTKMSEIPSIKEFTDNVRRLFDIKFRGKKIHLSQLTEEYLAEYHMEIDPQVYYSKSWMMLVKTTFKDFLQIRNEYVELLPRNSKNLVSNSYRSSNVLPSLSDEPFIEKLNSFMKGLSLEKSKQKNEEVSDTFNNLERTNQPSTSQHSISNINQFKSIGFGRQRALNKKFTSVTEGFSGDIAQFENGIYYEKNGEEESRPISVKPKNEQNQKTLRSKMVVQDSSKKTESYGDFIKETGWKVSKKKIELPPMAKKWNPQNENEEKENKVRNEKVDDELEEKQQVKRIVKMPPRVDWLFKNSKPSEKNENYLLKLAEDAEITDGSDF